MDKTPAELRQEGEALIAAGQAKIAAADRAEGVAVETEPPLSRPKAGCSFEEQMAAADAEISKLQSQCDELRPRELSPDQEREAHLLAKRYDKIDRLEAEKAALRGDDDYHGPYSQ